MTLNVDIWNHLIDSLVEEAKREDRCSHREGGNLGIGQRF